MSKLTKKQQTAAHADKVVENIQAFIAKPAKAPHKSRKGVGVSMEERRKFMYPLIKAATFTRKEILDKCAADSVVGKCTRSANATILTDSANPKYNKYDKLVETSSKGIVRFAK